MVFSSIVFLFLFLPIVLAVYLILGVSNRWAKDNRSANPARNLWILVASLVFYAWGEPILILVMLASAVVDFTCGLGISGTLRSRKPITRLAPCSPRSWDQKAWLVLSICFGVGLLTIFKYSGFAIDNYNIIIGLAGLTGLLWHNPPHLTLPLGISFYTFQSMSYTIDVYRGKVKANRNPITYLSFVTLFPQLVAGPIVRYSNIENEMSNRSVTWPLFASGVQRFVLGMGKKVLIANTLAGPADHIFAIPITHLTPGIAWIGIAAYTLQLYFDFSGYSDMAIGLGRMLGFHFMENFEYPYISRSITEFWRRWHISLSTWFRDYVYIPLGGNRGGAWTTYRNLITIFFLCGLWHGASWTFIAWGLCHGALLVIERLGFGRWLSRGWWPIGNVYAVLAVMIGWVLFRSETLPSAVAYLHAMFGASAVPSPDSDIWRYLSIENLFVFAVGIIAATPLGSALWSRASRFGEGAGGRIIATQAMLSIIRVVALSLLFVACAARLSSGTYNPFIYFRF